MGKRLKDVRRAKPPPAMPPGEFWVLTAKAVGQAVAMAALVLVAYYRSGVIRMAVNDAQRTKDVIKSDSDLMSTPNIMGLDYALCEYIFRTYPVGTHVHLDYRPGHGSREAELAAGRMARFYLALFPQYPDVAPYTLVIRLKGPRSPDEEVLVRGDVLDLLQCKSPQGGGK